ncbi:hypothetical protein [Microbacterium sp. RG1]|uniref:hypothetical protein n=1 Tax=Microbacterium sp. RG1 TaxID=2489212 RepID=UPI0010CA3D3B|nr:hypothetical protein [Microbacterium sp. RG1]QCQ16294.1 hypothetical protein EHF32_05900 [Microbacterium sp. RG1]
MLLGIAAALLILYATSLAANVVWGGGYSIHPMSLVSLAVVGVAVTVLAWRWPIVGLAAGSAVLALVAVAIWSRLAWVSTGSALDPFNAIAFAAASAYPTLMGATAITVSALRLKDHSRA